MARKEESPHADEGQRPPLQGKQVLVAAENRERLERILSGHRITAVGDVDAAQREMEKREYDLIVIGVHFDESRMFELLRLVRITKLNSLSPVVCVLSGPSRLSDVAIEGLDHAVKAMLANAFLNFGKFPDDASGNARLRRIFDYLILIDGDIHGGFKAAHEDDAGH